jgi:hypothetical protein
MEENILKLTNQQFPRKSIFIKPLILNKFSIIITQNVHTCEDYGILRFDAVYSGTHLPMFRST